MGFGIKTRYRKFLFSMKMVRRNKSVTRSADLDLLLLCHALEKGMGLRDSKPGHGREKSIKLTHALLKRRATGDSDSYVFKEALAVLRAFALFQREGGVHIEEVESALRQLSDCDVYPCEGGFIHLSREQVTGEGFDFASFARRRHTMRSFALGPVSEDELLHAVEIAKSAPSACNREPWNVFYSFNPSTIDKIRLAVPKQGFLADVPYFMIVTVDRSLFNPEEINQWFINGGIFVSYLILALHSLGIGSCVLQFPTYRQEADKLRASLRIPEKDEFIAVVGYGRYPDEARCIRAYRRDSTEIAVNLG